MGGVESTERGNGTLVIPSTVTVKIFSDISIALETRHLSDLLRVITRTSEKMEEGNGGFSEFVSRAMSCNQNQ